MTTNRRDLFREDDDLFAPIGAHYADHLPEPPAQSSESDDRVPMPILDKYFDGELRREESKELFSKLRRRPDRAKEAVWMQRAIDALTKPIHAPDFTASVLAQVGAKRAWLPRKDRIAVWALRYAAVFILVGMSAAAYTLERIAPEATALTPRVAPVSSVVDAVSDTTQHARQAIPASLASVPNNLLFPANPEPAQSCQPAEPAQTIFITASVTEPQEPEQATGCRSAMGLIYCDSRTTIAEPTFAGEIKKPEAHRFIIISNKK